MTRAKIAGLVRGGNKIPQGAYATDSDANRQDGIDATHLAKMQRGYDPTYAFARDAINADNRKHGAPNVFITGDELALNAESFIALLADLTVLVGGGGPFTNNNTATFVQELTDDESPLYEETVLNLVAASSQYLSLPTQATIEVGTGSFLEGIKYKTSSKGINQTLFFYGSKAAGKTYHTIQINSSDKVVGECWDGTNTVTVTDPVPGRWQDGKVHDYILFLDTSLKTLYLLIDGQLVNSATYSTLNTLTIASENLYIGAQKNSSGTIDRFADGRLGLYKIAKAADYNLTKPWIMGEREATVSGSFSAPTTDSAKRLNNKFTLPATANSYTKCVKEFEDGVYDLIALFERQASGGTLQIYIDDILILSQDTSGSAGSNISTKATGIKIGSGKHVVKVKNTVAQTIPLQWIKFMKTDGKEFWNGGGVDYLLLGDQFKRANNPLTLTINTGAYYNNDVLQTASPALNDYMEGDIYLSPGLYYYSYHYPQTVNKGKITLKIGDVIVFQDFQANGSTTNNSVKSGWVRLKGGKQTIRIQVTVDGASSKFEIAFSALRLIKKDLVRGHGNQSITYADQDFVQTGGTATSMGSVISSACRFNGQIFQAGTPSSSDAWKYTKYFSRSGLYKVRYTYVSGFNLGKLNLGIDSNATAILNTLDLYAAIGNNNNVQETIVEISRGFHDITFAVNGKNASSSSYYIITQALEFESIEAYTIVGSAGLEEDGKLQLLAIYKAGLAESTMTFNLGGMANRFSKLILVIHAKVSASLALQLQANGITSGYFTESQRTQAGAVAFINTGTSAQWQLASTTLLASTNVVDVEIEIEINEELGTVNVSNAFVKAVSDAVAIEEGGLISGSTLYNPLTSLTMKTSTSTWIAGTTAKLYGVAK